MKFHIKLTLITTMGVVSAGCAGLNPRPFAANVPILGFSEDTKNLRSNGESSVQVCKNYLWRLVSWGDDPTWNVVRHKFEIEHEARALRNVSTEHWQTSFLYALERDCISMKGEVLR